jgi:hypothetical protein
MRNFGAHLRTKAFRVPRQLSVRETALHDHPIVFNLPTFPVFIDYLASYLVSNAKNPCTQQFCWLRDLKSSEDLKKKTFLTSD